VQREVAAAQADVACFQEVQVEVYQRDLAPWMSEQGYDGVLLTGTHEAKWAEKGDPPGDRVTVATFWRRESFSLVDEVHRHRTLGLVLSDLKHARAAQGSGDGVGSDACDGAGCSAGSEARDGALGGSGHAESSSGSAHVGTTHKHGSAHSKAAPTRSLAVANVHLEGGGDFAVHRLKQLHRVLSALAVAAPHHGLVVAGASDTLMSEAVYAVYLMCSFFSIFASCFGAITCCHHRHALP